MSEAIFMEKIRQLNAKGHTHHVFQEYGSPSLLRGHSKSFHDYASAEAYAKMIPSGSVYDRDGKGLFFSKD